MELRAMRRRTIWLFGAIFGAFCYIFYTLYNLQIVNGAQYAKTALRKIASEETVYAARGSIYDRNGVLLVSDRAVYSLALNVKEMDDRIETLQTLFQICQDEGAQWNDTLPISMEKPFEYTSDTPFFIESIDDAGNTVRSLTRFGKLCLQMNWISGSPAEDKTVYLPTAEEMITKIALANGLCEQTRDNAQAAVYSPRVTGTVRALVGVFYELLLREKGVHWQSYCFLDDASVRIVSTVKERALQGVVIEKTAQRQYHTEYGAHILGRVALMNESEWSYYQTQGYTQNEKVGKDGAEKAFEAYLRPQTGVQVINRNQQGAVTESEWLSMPVVGNDVYLTLDWQMQEKVESVLAKGIPALKSEQTQGGAAVLIDVNSGEILSLASYPTYQLDSFVQQLQENSENPLRPYFNRAVQGAYAPGSTFKMVTAIAALEEEVITPEEKIVDKGVFRAYDDYQPQCWSWRQHQYTHGAVDMSKAIEVSCNYYFYQLGYDLGAQRINQYAKMFGLGRATGIELEHENLGILAGPDYAKSIGKPWNQGATLAIAIGQEANQFSPLQLANYIATLVNGGEHYAVHILNKVQNRASESPLLQIKPHVLDSLAIKEENLQAVKQGMLNLTTQGAVARYFKGLDFLVGAKTGSAQVAKEEEANAVFVCFAPYDNPQVALALVVERGSNGGDLGAMAAEILSYYFYREEENDSENDDAQQVDGAIDVIDDAQSNDISADETQDEAENETVSGETAQNNTSQTQENSSRETTTGQDESNDTAQEAKPDIPQETGNTR